MADRFKEELVFGVNTCSVIIARGSSRARSLCVLDSRSDQRIVQLLALAAQRGLPVERLNADAFEQQVQAYCDQQQLPVAYTRTLGRVGISDQCRSLCACGLDFLSGLCLGG